MRVRVTQGEVALRYLHIMSLFTERKRWKTAELAERLGITHVQVERDLVYLSTEPFYMPIQYDRDVQTYWIDEDWRPRL